MTSPTITLCVLTYNRASDLDFTIQSYLQQTYENSEMVIMDDASPDDTRSVVTKWAAQDKRIKYIRNKKNLGLSSNFKKAFEYCTGKYIVFLGDDDVFVDNNALEEYVNVFAEKNIGVLRARQILFRNWKVFQAVPLENNGKLRFFKKGKDGMENFIYDTASIAGLGYINNRRVKSLLDDSSSMYPQVELAANICLFYDCGQINKYLIGVQSHAGQLNVLSYSLQGVKTNILDDMASIYDRVAKIAENNALAILSKKQFLIKITDFLPLFLPYNTLKNGRKNTLHFITVMKRYNPHLYKTPLFMLSLVIIFLPAFIQRFVLDCIGRINLQSTLGNDKIKYYNTVLNQYI